MSIEYVCPHCGDEFHVSSALAGKRIRCRNCDAFGNVPKRSKGPIGYRCPYCRSKELPVLRRSGAGWVRLIFGLLFAASLLVGIMCYGLVRTFGAEIADAESSLVPILVVVVYLFCLFLCPLALLTFLVMLFFPARQSYCPDCGKHLPD